MRPLPRLSGVLEMNGLPATTESGNDVTPSPPSMQQTDLTSSLEALFANIHSLLKIAVEKSRDREEQMGYEKSKFQVFF